MLEWICTILDQTNVMCGQKLNAGYLIFILQLRICFIVSKSFKYNMVLFKI